ncbi:MAG: hypothetical protein Kow0029_27850 [Candidatus Rifleibacteriota bacterium]
MWTAVQIAFCILFLIAASFWIGKMIGKRRYLKLHEELKALELSFKQVVDDLELAANHNMAVFEKQSEELRELLTIADKKILSVNDYLKELDEACSELKRKTANSLNSSLESSDIAGNRKFRQEITESIDYLSEKIENFSSKLKEFENDLVKAVSPQKIDYKKIRSMIDEEVARQVSKQLSVFDKAFESISPSFGNDRVVPIRSVSKEPSFEAPPEFAKQQTKTESFSNAEKAVSAVPKLNPANIEDGIRMPTRKAELGPSPELPSAAPGTPVFEVLKMAENGVTLPQIARTMGMGKGEVQLILKLYGSGIKMRSVV